MEANANLLLFGGESSCLLPLKLGENVLCVIRCSRREVLSEVSLSWLPSGLSSSVTLGKSPNFFLSLSVLILKMWDYGYFLEPLGGLGNKLHVNKSVSSV